VTLNCHLLFKIILHDVMDVTRYDLYGLRLGSIAYSCEHGKELARLPKGGKCINQVRDYCRLKEEL
jgi:hypothetical protein